MELRSWARRLRQAAEAIEAVFVGVESRQTARAILADVATGRVAPKRRRLHWTQRPENRAKVARMARRAAKTRRAGVLRG